MDHKIAFELLEAYAFGTLDEDERAAVDTHLQTGCAECLERLREVSELSVRLAQTVPQVEAPACVKDRLFERVRSTHRPAKTARAPSRRVLRLAWSTAALTTAAAGLLWWQTTVLRREVSTTQRLLKATIDETARLRTEISTQRAEIEKYRDAMILGEPGVRFVSLDGLGPNRQAFGSVVTKPDKSAGMMYVYRFPTAPGDKVYQLWGLCLGKPPVSLGTFTVNADGTAMLSVRITEPTHIIGFAVTIEPKGGMPQPTGMMYVKGMDPMEGGRG
jgi:anti-sigma-K factor RskA